MSTKRADGVSIGDREAGTLRDRDARQAASERHRPVATSGRDVSNDALRLGARLAAGLRQPHQIVVLSGVSAKDGVSAAALEAARGLAMLDEGPVLLVDIWSDQPLPVVSVGESRRSTAAALGLSDILTHDAAVSDAIRATETPGLFGLPCGTRRQELRVLLMSEPCAALFHELRAEYAYVVVHSPPLLDHPECVRLAMRADGVVLVANEGRHREPELRQAKQSLEAFDLGLLGIVLSARPSWWR